MMIKNSKKRKGCWIALILVLVVILIMAGGFSVIKSYLGQISRTYNQSFLETVAQEDENFEADEVGEHYDATTEIDTVTNQGDENVDADTSEEIAYIDPDDVEWDFIERLEDDHLINILLVGQDRREGESRQRSDTIILCSINLETG